MPVCHASSSLTRPPWAGLAVLLLGGFVTIFDLFVVNVAIPSMQSELGASYAQVGFIVAGYELAFGAALILGGRLGDRLGRRLLFRLGMAGFTIASALCGLAPDAGFLIGARILQGFAAALLFPQIYASIRVHFSDADSRRAFSLLGMTLGLAAIAGQVLGGWLIHADLYGSGWRSIFLINVPIGVGAIIAAGWLPESRAPQRPYLDWTGAALISTALALLLTPLIEGPAQGWPAWSIAALLAAALLLVLFPHQQARLQRRGASPLIDMRLLTHGRFALGTGVVLLIYATSSSFFLCFALLVQNGFGLSPLMAGSIFAPCSVGFVLASLLAPRFTARLGAHAIVGGALLYALAIALLIGQVWLSSAGLNPVHLIPVLVIVGAGQGLVMTPLLNLVLGEVATAHAGMAAGILSTAQQIGAALGVAVVGMQFRAGLGTSDTATLHTASYSAAFVAGMLTNLLAAVMAAALLLWLARPSRTVPAA